MKNFLNLPTLLLIAISAMFMVSCGDDDPSGDDPMDDPTNVPPVVSLISSDEVTVEPGATFTIDFSSSVGSDSPLNAVTVYEDGVKVPTSRLTINGAAAAANPLLVIGDEKQGLTWTIDVVAGTAVGTTVYEVEVQDEAGGKNSTLINVIVAGTPPILIATPPTSFEVPAGSSNAFKLIGIKGTGELASIVVIEDDIVVEASRLSWNGVALSGTDNPFPLSEDEKNGFGETVLIVDLPTTVGEYVYTMILMDEFDLMSTVTYTVTTTPTGTALEMREDVTLDILNNAGGPQGTGGLDLDTGASTNSDDEDAEIKDNGLDPTLPPGDNWYRTISPIKENGVSMRYLIAGQSGLSETFLFSDVQFKEDLPGLFNNGVELVNDESNRIEVEDVFIVERDGNYWILEVIQIVDDPNNNEDSYTFDVKY